MIMNVLKFNNTCTLHTCLHGASMSEPNIDELVTINILSVGTLYVIHTVRICIHNVGNDYLAHNIIILYLRRAIVTH